MWQHSGLVCGRKRSVTLQSVPRKKTSATEINGCVLRPVLHIQGKRRSEKADSRFLQHSAVVISLRTWTLLILGWCLWRDQNRTVLCQMQYLNPLRKLFVKIRSVCCVLKPVCAQIISYFSYSAQNVLLFCYKFSRFQRKCGTTRRVF